MLELCFRSVATIAPPPAVREKSLLTYIAEGREIGYVIILLSFVAFGLIIAAAIRLRSSQLAPPEQIERLHRMLSTGKVGEAVGYCREDGNASFLTDVVGAALVRCSRSPFGFLEVRSALEEAGQARVGRLYRSIDVIGLIAAIAPMLGLLGTVVGMVGAFDTISVTEGVTKPDLLAGHISQALMTTVMGLIVAIPTTAAYAYLRNRIDAQAARVAEVTEELVVHLEQAGRRSTPAAQPQAMAQSTPQAQPTPVTQPSAGAVRPRPVPSANPGTGQA